jgi:hypothetical protein
VDGETDVYRLYGGDLEEGLTLLYVGISVDARQRFINHRRRSFWELVTYATITRYATRSGAEIVEAHAIATERPVLNIRPGSSAARRGKAGVVDLDQFRGYMECPFGWTDRQWAA